MGLCLASPESLDSELSKPLLTEYHQFLSRHDLNPQAKRFRHRVPRSQPNVSVRHGRATLAPRPVSHTATRKHQPSDTAEDLALARSYDVKLPGEDRRPPSLERQDAFRDGTTVKRKRPQASAVQRGGPSDEELYRRGILYDDEYLRGELFSLGEIVHDAPVWNVRYRPAKRRGRTVQRRGDRKGTFEELKLALSFTRLCDDEKIRELITSERLPGGTGTRAAEGEAVEAAVEASLKEHVAYIKARITSLTTLQPKHSDGKTDPLPLTRARSSQLPTLGQVREKELKPNQHQEQHVPPPLSDADDQAGQRIFFTVTTLGPNGGRVCDAELVEDEPAIEHAERQDAQYYDLVSSLEQDGCCKNSTAPEAVDDDNDDWAFLDDMEDAESNDATTTAPTDAEPDDTWIMLSSPGS